MCSCICCWRNCIVRNNKTHAILITGYVTAQQSWLQRASALCIIYNNFKVWEVNDHNNQPSKYSWMI